MAEKDRKSTGRKPAKPRTASPKRPKAGSPRPGKMLVIVESPAKAKTINRYLGDDYAVKACMGHVRDLPRSEIGVDVDKGFQPTYEPLPSRKKVLSELRKSAKGAPAVYLATDLDREGEAIAWHLAEALGVAGRTVRRVIFNEITPDAIAEAFAHPRAIDMDKVNAQQARRILDRIVGYQISPLLWRKVATGLSAGRVQSVAVRLIVERERQIEAFVPEEYWRIHAIFTTDLPAAERVAGEWDRFIRAAEQQGQVPTRTEQQQFLAERQAFQAELAKWRGERFQASDAEAALEVAKALGLIVEKVDRGEDPDGKGPAAHPVTVASRLAGADERPAYAVRAIHRRRTRSRPPAPFTTATLQQAASVQLRLSASATMRVAQQIYEGIEVAGEGQVGLITYMRTDSTHLADEAANQARRYIGEAFGAKYVPDKPNTYAPAQRAQEAHEAVRPTSVRRRPEDLAGTLTREQARLYGLIWRRFVACQMPPALWDVTEAEIVADTPAGQAGFKAMGKTLVFDGFLKVAGLPKSAEQILPPVHEGQPVAPVVIRPKQQFTQPAPRYTEASLIKALEADGIGRPSTYASIIQTIQDRQYVQLQDRAFRPTHLGIVVTDKLVGHFPGIFDVHFTARMESRLDEIEEARLDWVRVLEDFYGPFQDKLKRAAEEMVPAKAETEASDYTCDACGKPMVYRFSKTGRYLACTGYPECRTTCPVDDDGRKVERKQVDVPCPECGKPMVLRRSKRGPFLGCSGYPDCRGTLPCDADGTVLERVKPEDVKQACSECGSPMAVRWKGRNAFLGCSRYPECRNTSPLPAGLAVQAPPKPKPKDAGVNCPQCGKPMLIRTGRRGEFLACSGFPKCRKSMDLSKLPQLKAQQASGGKPAAGE